MKTSDFDYSFPKELIAHEPALVRDHSRLMVLDRARKSIQHKRFYNLLDFLTDGDLLVLNDTKVIPANLTGIKAEGGAKIEVLLVKPFLKPETESLGLKNKQTLRNREFYSQVPKQSMWICLVRPGKRLNVGSKVIFGDGELTGKVLEKLEGGEQVIEFTCHGDFWKIVHDYGDMPLPPYISPAKTENRKQRIENRYQTIYASKDGASAAPTAGLHFTPELLERIQAKGIKLAYLTLHTGLATFRPVYAENIKDHKMHSECFEVPSETIEAIEGANRVIAVGTTSVRALETAARSTNRKTNQRIKDKRITGLSDLFIYPGYKFKVVDAMITNFHWPRSTLIMLVSAFVGKDFIMRAYQEAIQKSYRLFSFGDAMLIF